MYEMAKKAREAMRGKAKRLAGEKDSKTDSSNWSPAEPLDADVKTGMRPLTTRAYKKGGKVEGAKAMTHAGRKPRKSGGRAITADSLINRNQKEANESREGKKHIGALKTGGKVKKKEGGFLRTLGDRVAGDVASDEAIKLKDRLMGNLSSALSGESYKKGGRTKKALGGMPADTLRSTMNPAAVLQMVRNATMGMKKGGVTKKAGGGGTLERIKNPNPSPDYQPSKPNPDYQPEGGPSEEDKKALREKIEERKAGGRAKRKSGGNVNYGPMEMPAGKKGASLKEQEAIAKYDQNLSKPARGKAVNKEGGGGLSTYGATSAAPAGADNRGDVVKKNAMNFGPGAPGSPYKKGGMAKHEDIAEDKALIRKMVKPAARTKKFGGGGISDLNMGPAKAAGGPAKGKGKTNINIVINPGAAKPDDQMAGIPNLPPGLPPRPPGGVPVPMGMPPGGAPPAPAPQMPMSMPPMAPPGGGMPQMARKAGGKVYRSYKDMDAGAGSGLGRLEKTEIQKRKA
jgi:hypothetical protein